MNIRGYFMLLMSTIWRTVVTQLKATFRYRLAGGSDNALLPERNGRAVFKKVYGKTVKWNQLVPEFDNWSKRSVSNFTIVDNAVSFNTTTAYGGLIKEVAASSGHQYYVAADIKRTTSSGTGLLSLYQDNAQLKFAQTTNETFTHLSFITTSQSANNLTVQIMGGIVTCGLSAKGQKLIDLTDNFGTNAEIAAALGIAVADITTATGVAAFENWLALNGGAQDYYPYDEGSLVSFTGSALKSVGWNKFHVVNGSGVADVKKGVKYYVAGPFGSLHYSDGTAISVASDRTFTAIKDDTITFGSVSNSIVLNIYTGTAKDGTYEPYKEEIVDLSGAYINLWDEQWELGDISSGSPEPSTTHYRSVNFTECVGGVRYYVKVPSQIFIFWYDSQKNYLSYTQRNSSAITQAPANAAYFKINNRTRATYNHDICINVSNADINGTYFPHALQSAGSVMDEVTESGLTKKLIEVDLGSVYMIYSPTGEHSRFSLAPSLAIHYAASIICDRIKCIINAPSASYTEDWVLKSTGNSPSTARLWFFDDSHSGADLVDNKAPWLQGIKLIYELATPIVIPHDTPMQYAVDKYSTEEVIVPDSADGSPTSTALVADIEYQAR